MNSIMNLYVKRINAPTKPKYSGANKKRERKRMTSITWDI